jgi:hypothetical protein
MSGTKTQFLRVYILLTLYDLLPMENFGIAWGHEREVGETHRLPGWRARCIKGKNTSSEVSNSSHRMLERAQSFFD